MLANLKSAVRSRNELLVRHLLQSKPRLDCQEGGEILWHAVLDDEVEIALMLVRAGADPNVRRPRDLLRKSLLHELVSSLDPRHHRLAVLMMDYGADVNAVTAHANGVLFDAVGAHHSAVGLVEELLRRGSRVTYQDIAKAAEHPLATQLLPLLIRAGEPDRDTRSQRVFTAFRYLIFRHGNESEVLPAAKMLLNMKLHAQMNDGSALLLFEAVRMNKIKLVQLLLAHKFDVTPEGETGYTLLHNACKSESSVDMIKLLVRHGADFNVIGIERNTPLTLLTYAGHLDEKYQFAIKRLAISAAKGTVINEVDLKFIESSVQMKRFYEQCRQELQITKLMAVVNDVTFFSVLASDIKRLSFLTRNEHFVQSYKDSLQNTDLLPLFCSELEAVLTVAEERRNLLLDKETALCQALATYVPYVPLERIIYNLYMNEI